MIRYPVPIPLTSDARRDIRRVHTARIARMAAAKKITKKQLKAPDEFITWGSRAMEAVVRRRTHIGVAILVVAAIVLSVYLWKQHVTSREEAAFAALSEAVKLQQTDNKEKDALESFNKVVTSHGNTRAADMALLYRGRLYLEQEKYDEAAADFTRFLETSPDGFMRDIALNALGTIYMIKGDCRTSLGYFEQILSSPGEWMKPFVLIRIGMCYETLGEKNKAQNAYQQCLELSPPPPWAEMAKLKLAVLSAADK